MHMAQGPSTRADRSALLSDLRHRVRVLNAAVVVLATILAVLLAAFAGPSVASSVLPPPLDSAAPCAFNGPVGGFYYYVWYNLSTGQLQGGLSSNFPVTAANVPTNFEVSVGLLNITNQSTLVHSIFCWWLSSHSGATPWHVDLSTGQIVAAPPPSPTIPTYLWLDPLLAASAVTVAVSWRFVAKRTRRRPPVIRIARQ